MNEVYEELGIGLNHEHIRGESFYNPLLKSVVSDLRASGLLVEDQGAQVVFCEGFTNKEGARLPLIVQKQDGGFGYAATDLAAGRFRAAELKATRLIYVVDARQSDHFAQVFWTLRAAGWVAAEVTLEHVAFGTILGKDKKPFKTRAGGTVRLREVLQEATQRAAQVIAEKSPELPEFERERIARAVGIGAVKFADLSGERIKDYVFDWDRMLALEGNTSPYLQNAYVRIQSILRKGEVDVSGLLSDAIVISDPAERALALELLQFPQTIESVARSLEPHRLCNYLCDLAGRYHSFHEHCRVLNAATEVERESRLALCHLVARTLQRGLGLLGIQSIERM
jgi:arginyl-tRNA synthetase